MSYGWGAVLDPAKLQKYLYTPMTPEISSASPEKNNVPSNVPIY